MNMPWSTGDQVRFVLERWPEDARAALLAALLEQAEWQGTVSVNGELWVHESKIRPLEKLLEDAGAQRMVLRTEAGRELAGYEMWLLPVPKEGEE